ncbi:hypothetical protein SAMN02745126_04838 [Enhydrobacter aerosaccus]|uniref:Uncharacterized protein n=1 Tax=Enhydrobacter aerosaccus TaxID=225324 RepID=A0A1T4SKQ5_9HYPH|nr:hypothetical protein [Enhydrobacter aerosaccus]SKA28870.1 hypothetical protein SAMN02745126_04838 [Enhydrobacter aerosaccus]
MSQTDTYLDGPVERRPTAAGRFREGLSDDDRKLMSRRFWISDPEALPNLHLRVPAKEEVPEIEYRYDLTPPKGQSRPYVRCAHCFRPIHWRGNVARYADGSRILLGCDCGEKQFGFRWTDREEAFSHRMSRHDLLVRLEGLEAALPLLHSFLLGLIEHPCLREFTSLRNELDAKMPELVSILTKVLQASGGTLELTERIRDIAAEIARDDRQKYSKNPDTKPIFKRMTKSLGRIEGGAFLLYGGSPSVEARNLADACEHLQAKFGLVGSDTLSEASELLGKAGSIVQAADRLTDRLAAANRFFELANLQTITQWLRKRMQLTAYSVSRMAFARVGATDAVRIERRSIALPRWSSRNKIGELLGI